MAKRVTGARPAAGSARVRVTLRRSLIGRPADQRRTAQALGLRRVGASRIHTQTPSFAGAVRKIQHLVTLEEVEHGRAG